jgi:hypothetical protein
MAGGEGGKRVEEGVGLVVGWCMFQSFAAFRVLPRLLGFSESYGDTLYAGECHGSQKGEGGEKHPMRRITISAAW